MLSRWILAFGMRREQPKTRRSKDTVKPRLEELTQRILLSAAASPQMAEEAMQMVATMMQEQYQLIVTVEDNFVQTYDTYIQRLAQLWASDVQQWKQFVGLEPPSGSGSGSGTISPTNDSANQQLTPIQPKSGSGTGSGATTSHENTPVMKMHPLTSGSGSGSGSGSVQFGSKDTLEWKPAGSGVIPWIDLSKGGKRLSGPTSTNPVIFDGGVSNTPITWAADVASITVQNGYNAQMTIEGDSTLIDNGFLNVDATSTLKVNFISNSTFQVKGGGSITNMILEGGIGGLFDLAGGTMTIDPSPGGYTENLGVNLTVEASAVLKYMNYDTLQLTDNYLTITVSGEMDTYWGSNNQNTMIGGGAANPNDSINVSDGTLVYYGRQNIKDTITVPIAVNSGTLKVTVDPNGGKPLQGTLIVQGKISTENVSVYLSSPPSLVTLDNYDTLECDNGYYQADGRLQTMDASTCTLLAGDNANAAVTIAGGSVMIGAANNGYGQLNVNAGTFDFNGQLIVAMAADKPGTRDWLNVSCITNLQANSSLKIYVNNGPPAPDKEWIIIQDTLGADIKGNVMPITTDPQTNLMQEIDGIDYVLSS